MLIDIQKTDIKHQTSAKKIKKHFHFRRSYDLISKWRKSWITLCGGHEKYFQSKKLSSYRSWSVSLQLAISLSAIKIFNDDSLLRLLNMLTADLLVLMLCDFIANYKTRYSKFLTEISLQCRRCHFNKFQEEMGEAFLSSLLCKLSSRAFRNPQNCMQKNISSLEHEAKLEHIPKYCHRCSTMSLLDLRNHV